MLTIVTAVLTVAYPLAVYYGLTRLGTRSVAILLAVLLVLGALLKAKTIVREPREALG